MYIITGKSIWEVIILAMQNISVIKGNHCNDHVVPESSITLPLQNRKCQTAVFVLQLHPSRAFSQGE